MSDTKISVGIDLGTSNSCICFFRNGEYELCSFDNGSRLLPSVVMFESSGNVVVGPAAKNHISHLKNFIVCTVKRIFGQMYDSHIATVMSDRCNVPFQRAANGQIGLFNKENNRLYKPSDIASELIKYLVIQTQKKSGREIGYYVFTIPALFNQLQRHEMEEAIIKAGIKEGQFCLFPEPTAAAISYACGDDMESGTMLIYDMGGGTFDVTIVQVTKEKISVLNHEGDDFLGGDSFDDAILDYVVKDVADRFNKSPLPPKGHQSYLISKRKLLYLCEKGKEEFASVKYISIILDKIYDNDGNIFVCPDSDYEVTINNETVSQIFQSHFDRSLIVVDRAILNAGLTKDDVSCVVLVGGSTRIPFTKVLIEKHFGNKIYIKENLNQDEIVAKGACILSESWRKNRDQPVLEYHGRQLSLDEATSQSIGIGGPDGSFQLVIPKNSIINGKKYRRRCHKSSDDCTEQYLYVYEGDEKEANRNHVVGKITWTGFPPFPARYVYFDVYLSISVDRLIRADVVDVRTGHKYIDNVNVL